MRDRVACSSRSIAWAASLRRVGEELERGRLCDGGRLDPREFLLERQEPTLRLGRQRLPHRPFLRLRCGALLGGAQRSLGVVGLSGGGSGCGLSDRDGRQPLRLQSLEFIPQLGQVGSVGGRGGWNGPGLKARSPKVRWNQTASCRATLRPASAVAWVPRCWWTASLPVRRRSWNRSITSRE